MRVTKISLKQYKKLILNKDLEFSQTYQFYKTYNLSHFKKIEILKFEFSSSDFILLPCIFTKNGCTSIQNTMGVHGFIEFGNIHEQMYNQIIDYLLINKKFFWVYFSKTQAQHFLTSPQIKTYENTYVNLSKGYEEIHSSYKHSFKESLRKGRKAENNFYYKTSFSSFRKFLKLYKENSKTINSYLSNLQLFLIYILYRKNITFWFAVNSSKKIVSTALTLQNNKICTGYIIITPEEGKKTCANSMLIDYQLQILSKSEQNIFYLGVSFENEGIAKYKNNISEQHDYCCIYSKYQTIKRS